MERRGDDRPREAGLSRLLVLAAFVVFTELLILVSALTALDGKTHWLRSVVTPLVMLAGAVLLYNGETWLRWMLGLRNTVAGGVKLFAAGYIFFSLAARTETENLGFLFKFAGLPLGVVAAWGFVEVAVGLLFFASPSLRAFLRYRREGPRVWIETDEE